MTTWLAQISVKCSEIGNCTSKTPDLGTGLGNIIHAIIGIVGSLALIFVIISGLQMALSVGNAKRYEQAKISLYYSIVGVIIAITAYAMVSFVIGNL